MTGFHSYPRAALLALLITGISCGATSAAAKTPESRALFSETSENVEVVKPARAKAGQSRSVKINHRNLLKGRLYLDLPGGITAEFVREKQHELGKGRSAWVGHASDEPESKSVLGISGDAVAGTFSYRGRLFKLEPRADGSHVVSEVEKGDPAPGADPVPVMDYTGSSNGATGGAAPDAADGDVVIDILVAYSPAVRNLYGAAGAEALVVQAVAETNQAYDNSAMPMRLNLVASVLTNYSASGDVYTDLARLRGTSDGYMDELHTLRNQHGADLVSLLQDSPQYCGLAYRMATQSTSFASSAFSIVHHSCATGYYSFAHEIGHNQGAHHDYANAGPAIFPYAYGYQEPNGAFRTIMAYNCPTDCNRINYFSNSHVTFNGQATGIPYYTENAYAIASTAATVAAFRQGVTLSPPLAPEDLQGTESDEQSIRLSWSDRSADESGFLLERSENGVNFVPVAELGANTTGYVDDGLAPDSLYSYRVRAWNGNGNSQYSNIAAAATTAVDDSIEQLPSFFVTPLGRLGGTMEDTWAVDGIAQTITEAPSPDRRRQRYGHLENYWLIIVQPGESITLHANVSTSGNSETFVFAYSTVGVLLGDNPAAWTDMFSVSAGNGGTRQFSLPDTVSGPVFLSVRDTRKVAGEVTRDSVNIDYLAIHTRLP